MIELTLKKSKFFDKHKSNLNERQLKAINKMLETLPEGFEGGRSVRYNLNI